MPNNLANGSDTLETKRATPLDNGRIQIGLLTSDRISQKDMLHMKPQTRPLLLIATALSAALLAACGGGGDSATSPSSGSGPDAQANKVATTTAPVSTSAPPVDSVISGEGWVSATPAALRERSTTPTSAAVAGTSYYVDIISGSDNNAGTIDAPWKTLTKAASTQLKSGDALLLKCGSVWRDSLTLNGTTAKEGNILIGAYGDCSGDKRPIIRASDWLPLDNWTRASDNSQPIFKRPWTGATIKRVFAHGQPVLPARYPNFVAIGKEFALATAVGSTSSFKVRAADLQVMADKDIVGATIHVRTLQWLFDTAVVKAFDPATGLVTLDRSLSSAIREGAGYILEGKRWMLDAPNEWFYESDTKNLVVWTPGGVNPATGAGLEVVTRDHGISIGWINKTRIERIRLEQQAGDGIRLLDSADSSVNDVLLYHVYEHGVFVGDSPRTTVKDSTIYGAGRRAIVSRNSDAVRIVGNHVTDTGGFGRSDDTEPAISVYSPDSVVSGNYIARSGSVGIYFQNLPGVIVENNSIYQPCLRLADCAGIHTWTASSSVAPATSYVARAMVRNNIIVSSFSNTEGCGSACNNLGTGIYLDEMTSGATVQNNFISDAEIGVGMHNAQFNVIESNTVRNIRFASIRAIQSRSLASAFAGNKFLNNSLVAEKSMALNAGLPSDHSRVHAFYWFHTSNPRVMFAPGTNQLSGNKVLTTQAEGEATWGLATWTTSSILTAAEWKAVATTDTTVSRTTYRPFVATTEANLVPNGDFDPALGAWSTYFDPGATGGSFSMGKFTPCGTSNCGRHVAASTADQLLSGSFKMNATSDQNLYVFRMTAIGGTTDGTRAAAIRRLVSPWDNYGLSIKSISVPAGKTVQVEQFFLAKNADAGILDLRSSVGSASHTRGVSVSRVSGIEFQNRPKLMANIINPTSAPLSFPCIVMKLNSCVVVDESGNKLGWPVVVPARSSLLIYSQDPKWKQ